MKRVLSVIFLLLIVINCFSQEKKLTEGWDRITLEGKTAYMNLITGTVSKTYSQKKSCKTYRGKRV